MRSQSILLLTLALGCGLVASIGISQVMDRNKTAPVVAGETETIYVALKDVAYNDFVTPKDIKLEEWPKGKIPTGALGKLEDIEGKRARTKLFAGEPILKAKLLGSDESLGVTKDIPPGFRVVTVRVDAVSGAGLILPGDRVDVLGFFNRNPGNGLNETTTQTILQDIHVFAVDTVTTEKVKNEKDDTTIAAKTVSLLVDPQQAMVLTMSAELGSIRLVMRSMGDEKNGGVEAVTIQQILSGGGNKHSDRKAEAQVDTAKATSLQEFLEKNLKPAESQTIAVEPGGRWKMTLVEGSVLRQVDFDGDNASIDLTTPKQPVEPVTEPEVTEPAAEPAAATTTSRVDPGGPTPQDEEQADG